MRGKSFIYEDLSKVFPSYASISPNPFNPEVSTVLTIFNTDPSNIGDYYLNFKGKLPNGLDFTPYIYTRILGSTVVLTPIEAIATATFTYAVDKSPVTRVFKGFRAHA